ncbi:GAF and ANTAR domain-containing protein [Rhodococcoides yunnanense]|uniref:GAF and ANTAR domain-containing protein n=1 Tax=Rhodococcoides yunnanense TaxID=278209 RepID=UPI00093507F3|nr:GAF and ANTAR domain-containing protein [Rhodococcus yunnanensis]
MHYDQEFVGAIARLAVLPAEKCDCIAAMTELNRIAIELLGLFGSGVTVTVAGRQHSIVESTARETDLTWFQDRLVVGPCRTTWDALTTVCLPDVRECVEQWPEIAAEARCTGIAGIAGIPMHIGIHCIGVLALYSDEPRMWREDDISAADVLASMTTGYLIDSTALSQNESRAARLDREVQCRIVVEQAKGMTADDRQVSVDQAYRLIEQHAVRHNTTVLAVAQAIVGVGFRVRS